MISLFASMFSFGTDSTNSLSTKLDTTSASTDSVMIDAAESPIQSEPEIIYPESLKLEYPVVKNEAFFVGEKLLFDISYGFIHAGTATMEVKPETILNEKPVYHIQTTARSASGFNWIYKVEDVIDSYIDKQGLFSWKFDKRLREGGYKADFLVDYFPEDSLARVSYIRYKRGMIITNQEKYTVKTPPFVLDVLAAFYYTRTQNLEIGHSIHITNHDNKKAVHRKSIFFAIP